VLAHELRFHVYHWGTQAEEVADVVELVRELALALASEEAWRARIPGVSAQLRSAAVAFPGVAHLRALSEQRVGLLATLQLKLACPFVTEILGVSVRVDGVDVNDADEIVAICRRGRQRQLIPILDLPLPSPPPAGWEWIEAYRHWARGGR